MIAGVKGAEGWWTSTVADIAAFAAVKMSKITTTTGIIASVAEERQATEELPVEES